MLNGWSKEIRGIGNYNKQVFDRDKSGNYFGQGIVREFLSSWKSGNPAIALFAGMKLVLIKTLKKSKYVYFVCSLRSRLYTSQPKLMKNVMRNHGNLLWYITQLSLIVLHGSCFFSNCHFYYTFLILLHFFQHY